MRITVGFLLFIMSSLVIGKEAFENPMKVGKKMKDLKNDPICKKIHDECKAKGYEMGGHNKNGMGIMVDCIGKIAKGESIEGVTVSKEEAENCKKVVKGQRHSKD